MPMQYWNRGDWTNAGFAAVLGLGGTIAIIMMFIGIAAPWIVDDYPVQAKITQMYADGTMYEWTETMTMHECAQYKQQLLDVWERGTTFDTIKEYRVECVEGENVEGGNSDVRFD